MSEIEHKPMLGVTGRRKLISGAFAAPVAMTLHSGSVAAASITCVKKQLTSPQYPVKVSTRPPGDTWVRVQLWYARNDNQTKTSWWIRGDSVAPLMVPGRTTYMSKATEWQLYEKNAGSKYSSLVVGTVYDSSLPGSPIPTVGPKEGGQNALSQVGDWVALRFDENGNITGAVGLGAQSGSSALGESCLTSFRMNQG